MPLERNHTFVNAHGLFDAVRSLPSCDKRPDHWPNLVRPIVARFSPCDSHRIICHMQKPENGEKAIPGHHRSQTWHVQKPVRTPVGLVRPPPTKSHHDKDGDESLHLCDVNICECFLDLLIRIRILCPLSIVPVSLNAQTFGKVSRGCALKIIHWPEISGLKGRLASRICQVL